ncbi:type I-C CRISPR-associated protein Cas7/Csd2 [Caldinitratiruptor microaerophilus]|uniref:Type I-C CRISPR-associated protein Cas7/Csd2 n=1 Tax=Caldinitratiruptor microaerophilus TaxID=671077 RepID=A0AA35CI14_9FIRM|nr:type I-C CRISPR-associated protein Cas7/Csd2 [Caldinitratiruptor microaerophilus]BDG59302.1 type I-C CRISPR-associated protein Cas7/Csd2 [Caldinitratiruptor microaerophilus]
MSVHLDPERRHDFVILFDVTDGNPNGDPDAGNLPRVDPETMQGLVTDVSIKRRIRNWVDATRGTEERMKIYVQTRGEALNDLHQRAYDALGLRSTGARQDRETVEQARAWMCWNFWDIRTFGAVMTTGVNCGQVRGPVQLTFARSIDPIVPLDLAITRVAVTRAEDAKVVVGDEGVGESGGKTTEMGRKAIVPYGLYKGYGFVNPIFARQTGFSKEDLDLFWTALIMCWDLDRSSSRGRMACRGLYVFTHDSPLGKAPAHTLLDRVRVQRRDGVVSPRSFGDYTVVVDDKDLPDGVTLTRLVG